MQNSTNTTPNAHIYRERLTPSLLVIISAAMIAPMASLVFLKIDQTIALVIGVAAAVVVVALLLLTSTPVTVSGGELTVGRAHIPVTDLGQPEASSGMDARLARGPGLAAGSFTTIRGGIDGLVTVEVTDPADPTPAWVVSSRTPDRLAAAILRAQAMQRTHGR